MSKRESALRSAGTVKFKSSLHQTKAHFLHTFLFYSFSCLQHVRHEINVPSFLLWSYKDIVVIMNVKFSIVLVYKYVVTIISEEIA
jgi:hypothetical protein